MKTNITVLVVMSPIRRCLLLEALEETVTHFLAVSGCGEARKLLEAGRPVQAVFTDSRLADGDWQTVVDDTIRCRPRAQVVVCASRASAKLLSSGFRHGVYDLLLEPFNRSTGKRCADS